MDGVNNCYGGSVNAASAVLCSDRRPRSEIQDFDLLGSALTITCGGEHGLGGT
jgi:hypothetical protein